MATVKVESERVIASGGAVDKKINFTGSILYRRKRSNKRREALARLQHEGDPNGSPIMPMARVDTTRFDADDGFGMYLLGERFCIDMNIA